MNSSIPSACVVIPHYRFSLDACERVSLERSLHILEKWPIYLAVPESLDTSTLIAHYPQLRIERFDDTNFADIDGYNRFMLGDAFYARFAIYDYMLIHQLDAFVFSDQLADWCLRGFDYVGAPWLRERGLRNRLDQVRVLTKQRLYRLLDLRDSDGISIHTAQLNYGVGNGGFSLRHIATIRAVLRKLTTRVRRYRERVNHTWNEDIFFGVEVNRYRQHLRIPRYVEAAAFAWEFAPQRAKELTSGELPFGCHAWNKLHLDFWRPLLARYGHDLDVLLTPAPETLLLCEPQ